LVLVTYDPDAKAMYFSLEEDENKKSKIAKTIPMGEGKYLEVTESNKPIGLEIVLPRDVPQEAVDAIVNRENPKIKVLR
jgi:uncharacterized protein YuzE